MKLYVKWYVINGDKKVSLSKKVNEKDGYMYIHVIYLQEGISTICNKNKLVVSIHQLALASS